MLAMADKDGEVMASIPGLADRAKVTLEECQAALACFLGPDEWSRTKDHGGRRIEEIDGGWRLLNFDKFRLKMSTEELRERVAARVRRHRAKKAALQGVTPVTTNGSNYTRPEADQIKPDTDQTKDPDLPVSAIAADTGVTDSTPRNATQLLRLFEHHWKARWNLPFRLGQWDQKTADALMRHPDPDEFEPAIKRYLASDDPVYVRQRHPFRTLERDFDKFRGPPLPPPDLRPAWQREREAQGDREHAASVRAARRREDEKGPELCEYHFYRGKDKRFIPEESCKPRCPWYGKGPYGEEIAS